MIPSFTHRLYRTILFSLQIFKHIPRGVFLVVVIKLMLCMIITIIEPALQDLNLFNLLRITMGVSNVLASLDHTG